MDCKVSQQRRNWVLIRTLGLFAALCGWGCSGDEDELDTINITVSADLELSWDGGPVGVLDVFSCEQEDTSDGCPTAIGCSTGDTMWFANAPGIENPIFSPIEYGTPVAGSLGASKDDLVPGATYSVALRRVGPCDEGFDGPDCTQGIARGCTLFTP